MAVQQGVVAREPGEPFRIFNSLPRPSTGRKQALVRSQFLAITPVQKKNPGTPDDTGETSTELCFAFCGIVVDTGEDCARLQQGDHVFGSCRPDTNIYSPFQETFLVDDDLVFKKPDNLTPEDAASVGIGLMTAAFGIIVGGKLDLPEQGSKPKEREKWIVILGGSSTVGQYAIQLGRLCGYQVASSCSPSEASILMERGTSIAFNNRASLRDQVAEAKTITDGYFALVFDATGVSHDVGLEALQASTEKKASFSTAEKVIGFKTPINGHRVPVGQLSRADDLDGSAAEEMAKMIPALEGHLANGTITPVEYAVCEGMGWEKLNEAMATRDLGKRKKCIIVRVQD